MGSGGKSGAAGKSYDYFGTLAVAICNGPVDVLHSITVEGKEIYVGPLSRSGDSTDLTGSIDPKYFADDGYLKIYWGTNTQTIDDALNTPALEVINSGSLIVGLLYKINSAAGGASFTSVGAADNKVGTIFTATGTTPTWGSGSLLVQLLNPDYRNIAYLVAFNTLFGTEKSTAPNMEVIVSRLPVCDITLCAAIHNVFDDGQVNPIAALGELLTSAFGQGWPLSRFDATTWAAAASYCYTNKTMRFCSPLITDVADVRSAITQLLTLAGAMLSWTASGTLAVKLLQPGVDPGSLPTWDYLTMTDKPSMQCGGWSDVPTGVIVKYFDRDRKYKESDVKLDNIAVRHVRGETQRTELNAPHVTRRNQAESLATEYLRLNQHPEVTADIAMRREIASAYRVGDKVYVDVDPEPGGSGLAQLAVIEERSDAGAGDIRFKLRADPLADATPYTPVFNPTPQIEATCDPIAHALVIPLPPIENDEASVAILATRPQADAIGFRINYTESSGGDVSEIGIQNGFACRMTLDAAVLTSGELTVNLKYKIEDNSGGADFTGVGAAANTVGTQFIATGTTPTWGTGKLSTVSEQVFANTGTLLSGTLRTGIRYVIEQNFDTDFTPIGGPDASDYNIGRTFLCTATGGITWGFGNTLLRTCTVQENDTVIRLSLPDTIDNYIAALTAENETNAENDHLVLILVHTGGVSSLDNFPQLELPNYDASIEALSIVSRVAVDSDTHDYTVLRARKGFQSRNWSPSTTVGQAWVIPGKDFESWSHYRMQQKILEGNFAVFGFDFMSLAAFTAAAEDESSPIPSFEFVFPADAFVKPKIEWTTPSASPHTLASSSLTPAATITDAQGDIIRVELFTTREDTAIQTKRFDVSIAPTASVTLADLITLSGMTAITDLAQGTTDRYYRLTCRVTDAAGHILESSIVMLRLGSGTSKGFSITYAPEGGDFVTKATIVLTRNGGTATQIHYSVSTHGDAAPTSYTTVSAATATIYLHTDRRVWARSSDGTNHSQWQFQDYRKVRRLH